MAKVSPAAFAKLHGDLNDVALLLTDDIPNRQQVTDMLMETAQAGSTFAGLEGLDTQARLQIVGAALLKVGAGLVEQAVTDPTLPA